FVLQDVEVTRLDVKYLLTRVWKKYQRRQLLLKILAVLILLIKQHAHHPVRQLLLPLPLPLLRLLPLPLRVQQVKLRGVAEDQVVEGIRKVASSNPLNQVNRKPNLIRQHPLLPHQFQIQELPTIRCLLLP
ncbi:MAG: hypothetical protein NTW33_04780, partial [Methanoregula sp.]|nr:hypothetical protein [Methanoregula sp.]